MKTSALAIIALTLLATSAASAKPTKIRAAAKKKPAVSTQAAPLTAESLGLGETRLSTIMAARQAGDAPPPTPPTPATAPPPPPAPAPIAPAPAPEPAHAPAIDLSASKDKVLVPRAEPRRRFTIGVNPLPMVAGRYGGNIEVVPFVHHGFIASAWYQTFTPTMLGVVMPKAVDVSHGAQAKVGGELGYRFYSARRGANGLFLGASGVVMPLALPRVTPDFRSEVVSFNAYGGAFDIGVQAITDAGFTIGGGIGAMYLAYDAPTSAAVPAGAPTVKLIEPHIVPRLLLAAGWSF